MSSALAKQVIERAAAAEVMISTAESCTGGLIAGALTDIAGSSAVFDRGFVTYSNEAKAQMLGVSMDNINNNGAVSDTVVRAMVAGALANSRAHVAVAVTGIAGPGGGTAEKPVGLVFIAVQSQDKPARVKECRFVEDGEKTRTHVRSETVKTALSMILEEM